MTPSLKFKIQLDQFLKLMPNNKMVKLGDISQGLQIRIDEVNELYSYLEDKGLLEIVGKPDYIGLTKHGRIFKLESTFANNDESNMEKYFNVYLGYSIPNVDRILVGITKAELDRLVDNFDKGSETIFIGGVKYELATLTSIRIFKSDRPHEYYDYLTLKANEGDVIHNRYGDVLFHVSDLSHFGLEVTKEYILNNFGEKTPLKDIKSNEFDLDIFISHSHKDKEIAKMIADLISKAFNLTNDRIRCTSAAGYKLKGGTKTMETLRSEVERSKLLIVLISENSVKSHYVLFELGARWGLELPYIPLFYNEDGAALLPGPLSNIIGISMSDNSDMHQFITDVSEEIKTAPQLPKVYNQQINDIVAFSQSI